MNTLARRVLLIIVAFGLGLALLDWLRLRAGAETPAPAQRQPDGSLILERRPDPAAQPRQTLPPRTKLERVAQVTVQPDAPAPQAGQPCPPVTVDLSLIRDAAGARRVLASSPDGQIVGGLDIPVAPLDPPPTTRRWAAGLSWSPSDRTSGLWLERDVKLPLTDRSARLGVDLNQAAGSGIDARVRIGMSF